MSGRRWRGERLPLAVLGVAFLPLAGTVAWLLASGQEIGQSAMLAGTALVSAVLAGYTAWLADRRRRVEEERGQLEREKAETERQRQALELQRHELDQLKHERDLQRVADEGFVGTVELLGHAAAQVRVGALYALAGIAAARPAMAQQVVDIVCVFLRQAIPAQEPGARHLRREAQKVLDRVLRAHQGRPVLLDLSDTTLHGLALTEVTLAGLDLSGAVLEGPCTLRGVRVLGKLVLSDAVFHGPAHFERAGMGELTADRTRFRQTAGFAAIVVRDKVKLAQARFERAAEFGQAAFGGAVHCMAVFADRADFAGCRFGGLVSLTGSRFASPPDFGGATFAAPPRLEEGPGGSGLDGAADGAGQLHH
ncbi:hypothetical protein N8J89_37160 [Crossiella sp. CA-258035]|uniref:pentapeptide repeat-containing protein n=1 Tax=Crossiella sp. CA-258035 TaxID=2981138 RepID=UPI0024BC8049|nr:pentapeptide repeat-containing protein [Crossiella sp. CA-258035]WHT18678.1 hypothetical protein N8J89_37160 [Crossiella sp. CA-258035]